MPGAVVESQAFPQVVGSGELLQVPSVVLQVSVVQTLLSLQFLGVPLQTPVTQTSFTVQGLLSLHAPPVVAVNLHTPVDVVQVLIVQGLMSSQTLVVPPPQTPSVQVVPDRHLFLLTHVVPLAALMWVQTPVTGSQPSVVQVLLSLQRVAASRHGSTISAWPRRIR
jgi:isopentenyl diphosphate isomerase/L-lactate dehydrogenase-like FMN-dependent dehydrogenase